MRDTMAMATEVAMASPRLRTLLDTPAVTEYNAAPDQTSELGLKALLDGLATNRAARRAEPPMPLMPPVDGHCPHTRRRAVAHLVSSCRLESCNFRSTAETWDSTVFTEM